MIFIFSDGICVHKGYKCNGNNECEDGTDEFDCGEETTTTLAQTNTTEAVVTSTMPSTTTEAVTEIVTEITTDEDIFGFDTTTTEKLSTTTAEDLSTTTEDIFGFDDTNTTSVPLTTTLDSEDVPSNVIGNRTTTNFIRIVENL